MTPRSPGRFTAILVAALTVSALIAGGCSHGGGGGTAGTGGTLAAPPAVTVNAPPLPTGAVATIPSSIASNCSTDVTAALESWVQSVPDNSTLVLGKHACYRIDGTLTLVDRTRLLLDGNGATLEAGTTGNRNRSQLTLTGGRDLTVRDLIVRGANREAGATAAAYHADLEAQHGFNIHGVDDVLLDRVQASNLYGDFVYIGADRKVPATNVTIANSRFERSGRQGISVTDATGVTIEANVISGVARSVFDLEPNLRTQTVRDIRIVGNVTGAAVNFWLANKGAAADIGNIQISGNRMAAATGGLVFVFAKRGTPRGPYVIEHNHMIAGNQVHDEGSTGAFFFTLADNVTVRDNTVEFPSGANMPAVELRNAHHVVVTGNQFVGAGRTLVASQGSSDYRTS